jgi:hypothetical protein
MLNVKSATDMELLMANLRQHVKHAVDRALFVHVAGYLQWNRYVQIVRDWGAKFLKNAVLVTE